MGYAATVHSFRKAIAEQGLIADISYATHNATSHTTIFDNEVDFTGIQYFMMTTNWGTTANQVEVWTWYDGVQGPGMSSATANGWTFMKFNILAANRRNIPFKITIKVNATPATAFIKHMKVYKMDS